MINLIAEYHKKDCQDTYTDGVAKGLLIGTECMTEASQSLLVGGNQSDVQERVQECAAGKMMKAIADR